MQARRNGGWADNAVRAAVLGGLLAGALAGPASDALAQGTGPAFLQTLESHRLIYVAQSWLPDDAGGLAEYDDQEILIQFSFKKRMVANLYIAYTQRSFWQVYDQENSRPVRENDYNPEFFLDYPGGVGLDVLRIGLWEHESNGGQTGFDASGRAVNRSRTWNRIYVWGEQQVSPGVLWIAAKLWVVTDQRSSDFGGFAEDNPDIQQYLGSGEVYGQIGNGEVGASVMLRHGWRSGTGTYRLEGWWSFNRLSGGSGSTVGLFFQAFSGYGDSLIDYNRKLQRVSVGLCFR